MFGFIRNAITKYKVVRMHAVINEYFGAEIGRAHV